MHSFLPSATYPPDQAILPNFTPRLTFVKNNLDGATRKNVCHGRGLAQKRNDAELILRKPCLLAGRQDKERAEYALGRIQQLYAVEREAMDMTPEERKELRLEKSLPIINDLGKWIAEQNKAVLPKSLIGTAFAYTINLWDHLQHYLHNGLLLIDNNLIENSIRPSALGRKNYLFAGSHEGAQRTAMFYTFTGTCKMQGVEPMAWLTAVLAKIADHPVNRLFELFPGNLDIPQAFTPGFSQLENEGV